MIFGKPLRILFFWGLFLFPSVPVLAFDVVVIDPGHGGYDSGIKAPGFKEKDLTLSIARHMRDAFREEDKRVYLTRKIDRYLSIKDRVSRASQRASAVFISLHLSGSDDFAVYVTWYKETVAEMTIKQYYAISARQRHYLYESRLLSSVIEETLKEEFEINVFHREMPLSVLNAIGTPAVLIEVPSEGVNYTEEEIIRVAYTIAIGVLFYEQR